MPPKKSNLIAALSEATSGDAESEAQLTTFTVVVTGEWFKKTQAGTKTLEYRVIKPYWTNRLIDAKTGKNKRFDTLKIT